jgi:hypothetical protein
LFRNIALDQDKESERNKYGKNKVIVG